MEQTLKIKLTKDAHDELMEMIKLDESYSYIRFVYVRGCCKTVKIDISLDNFKTGDIKSNIGDLPILYDEVLVDKIEELTIAYKDSRFWIKTKLPKDREINCSTDGGKSCSGCSGSCGSH